MPSTSSQLLWSPQSRAGPIRLAMIYDFETASSSHVHFSGSVLELIVQRARVKKTIHTLRHGGRPMDILCPKCHVGRIDRERCHRCGYRASRVQDEQERMGRLVRNGLIGLVSVLAVF